MSNINSPENIRSALDAVEEELIALVGEAWPTIALRYRESYRALAEEEGKWLASVEIKELFAPYQAARKRLDAAIVEQDVLGGVRRDMIEIAASMGGAPAREDHPRFVFMKGPSKAKSIKLGNIKFDLGETTELSAGVLLTTDQIFSDLSARRYVLVAAGVLLVARHLYKAISIDLSEREATVFYGFTQAAGEDKTATEAHILERANRARAEIPLTPLGAADVKIVLQKLSALKSVEKVVGRESVWRIIEKYRVKT